MKSILTIGLLVAVAGCSQVYVVGDDKYECNILDYECKVQIKSMQEAHKEQQRQAAQAEQEKREKWEKARIRCEDYIDYIDGVGWFSTGYGNRLYDRCEYNQTLKDCFSWAHKVADCVKRECMFAPVYYDKEETWHNDTFITKSQFDKCF